MPHARKRIIEAHVLSELKWSPAVGVYGLRQVGKTTLMEKIIRNLGGEYETFDSQGTLQSAQRSPFEFCSRSRLLCIDEVQKAPEVFPAIKQIIGTKRVPARFLLTGSARFTLRKDVREALTGRVLLHELLPFNFSESNELPSSKFLSNIFNRLDHKTLHQMQESNRFGSRGWQPRNLVKQLQGGGLPVPCFARDAAKQSQWFRGYFETLLTRDLALVDEKLAAVTLRQGLSFLNVLALRQGQELSFSELSSQTSLRSQQVRIFLAALEALGLIDWIPPEVRSKKSIRKQRLEWKDCGLWRFALGANADRLLETEQAMQILLSQEFRAQLNQLNEPPQWSFYKSRDAAQIPWIFRGYGKVIALTHLPLEAPKPYDYKSLSKFAKSQSNHFGIVIGSMRAPIVPLGARLFQIPYPLVF